MGKRKIKVNIKINQILPFFPLLFIIIIFIIMPNINSNYIINRFVIYNTEEILIKINKSGKHNILSPNYNNCPNQIYINNDEHSFTGTNCKEVTLVRDNNIIKLIWTQKVTNCDQMFFGCTTIDEIDLSNFDTSSVQSMVTMFRFCYSLTSLNLSNKFSVANVINFKSMFYNCTSLSSLDLSNFITSNGQDMSYMFNGCISLTSLDLSKFITKNVYYMNYMFRYCEKLTTLNLLNFNTQKTQTMGDMFHGCSSLISLDLSSFDITNVKNMSSMFYNCKNLEYIKLVKGTENNDLLTVDTFKNVPENIVFCLNEKFSKLISLKESKLCSQMNCEDNWRSNQKKIIFDLNKCIEDCNQIYPFEYENKCFKVCPITNNVKQCKYLGEYATNYIKQIINNISNVTQIDFIANTINNETEIILKAKNKQIQISTLEKQKESTIYSSIDLGPCEDKLRRTYNISEDEDLIILKIEHYLPNLKVPIIEFKLFNQNGTINFNLSYCENNYILYTIPVDINEEEEYKYNPNSNYYNDECNIDINNENIDMTLYDKRMLFNKNNMSLCEINCIYKGYDYEKKKAKCDCPIKSNFISIMNITIDTNRLIYNFKNIKSITNLNIMKCYKILLLKENLICNIGSYILLFTAFISFILMIIFCCKDKKSFIDKIKYIKSKINNNNNNLINTENIKKNSSKKISKLKERNSVKKNTLIKNKILPLKKRNTMIRKEHSLKNTRKNISKNKLIMKKRRHNSMDFNSIINSKINKKGKKENDQNILQLNGYEINNLSYNLSKLYDSRTYCVYYFSLIKKKQLIIFSFFIKDDNNLKTIKINLFLISFSSYFFVNTLFFNDSTMHKIMIDEGKFNFIYQLPQIIYSSIICSLIKSILNAFALTEKNITQIKLEKTKTSRINLINKIIKNLCLKFLLFYVLNFLLIIFFWYYLSCFCAIYRNTQIHLIKDTIISFGISLFTPFFNNIFPGIFRIHSLNDKKGNHKGMYKFSKFLQYIL